jgi:hypothetical protein
MDLEFGLLKYCNPLPFDPPVRFVSGSCPKVLSSVHNHKFLPVPVKVMLSIPIFFFNSHNRDKLNSPFNP